MLKGEKKVCYTITLDDDPIICRIIEGALDLKSFCFGSASELKHECSNYAPVAVFIDVHLANNESGIDIIPHLKKEWPDAPIIVITSDPSSELVGQALAAGAEDFVRKPIDPVELQARLKARMAQIEEKKGKSIFEFGDIQLDIVQKTLTGSKGSRSISSREAELLTYLIKTNGMVVSKDILKRRLWGNIAISNNALDRKIFEVRKAIREVSSDVEIFSAYGAGLGLRLVSHEEDSLLLDDYDIQRSRKKMVGK